LREDLEDWTQDLIIHLKYLPLKSKHREVGKEDTLVANLRKVQLGTTHENSLRLRESSLESELSPLALNF
jgi:hypothetical protein